MRLFSRLQERCLSLLMVACTRVTMEEIAIRSVISITTSLNFTASLIALEVLCWAELKTMALYLSPQVISF